MTVTITTTLGIGAVPVTTYIIDTGGQMAVVTPTITFGELMIYFGLLVIAFLMGVNLVRSWLQQ
jgi:hypothetical protein